jgi:hypothetical protein
MLIQIEPIYHEKGWKLFSIASLAFHEESLYSGDGIDAVHMSFAIDEGIESILSEPMHLLTKKEVTRRVQWINIRLRVSCAGLLELNQWSTHVPLGEFGNLKVQYIHRTAKDFLDTLDGQKTPIGKFRSTMYHVPTRLLKANVAYIKSCVKLNSHSRDELTLLTPIIKRTMWLTNKAELETGHDEFEVLRDMECTLTKLLGPSIPWSNFMAIDESSGVHSSPGGRIPGRDDDFVSLAIMWGLNRYLAKALGEGNKLQNDKKGTPYLDYAIPKFPGPRFKQKWDLATIRLLLQYGCNPNQAFNEISPWQYVLSIVQGKCSTQDFAVDAKDFEIYFRHDGIRPKTLCLTYLGSPFELMLNHGADPDAHMMPFFAQNPKYISVLEIISCSLANSPEDVAVLVTLLPEPSLLPRPILPSGPTLSDLSLSLPKPPESRFSRFKLKVGFGK